MKRREFLATTLGATALATSPNDTNAQEKSDGWKEGQVHHLLPTANHNRVLIKASLKAPLSRAPKLRMGSTLATTIQTDTQGYFWAFDIHDLDPDSEYECTLTDNSGRPLCDTWPLKTFPHPDQSNERLRLLIYTCAGGHDGLAIPGGPSFVPIPHRRELLKRALSFSPDAVVSIGSAHACGPDVAQSTRWAVLIIEQHRSHAILQPPGAYACRRRDVRVTRKS